MCVCVYVCVCVSIRICGMILKIFNCPSHFSNMNTRKRQEKTFSPARCQHLINIKSVGVSRNVWGPVTWEACSFHYEQTPGRPFQSFSLEHHTLLVLLIKLIDSNTFSPQAIQSHREPQKDGHFIMNVNYQSKGMNNEDHEWWVTSVSQSRML